MKLNIAWDIAFAAALIYCAFRYFAADRASFGISKGRQLLFVLALTLLTTVLVGPVPHIATRNFTAHMIQHISLMMLISPLIVLGSPFKIFRIDRGPFSYLLKPEVGFSIFLATLIATHFSPLANAGMRNSNVHSFELILFIFSGTIYYYSVMEGNPQPFHVPYSTRVISLFAMMLPETMTGFFLYSGNRMVHSLPDSISEATGLKEQHAGGAIMWAMGMLIDTVWIVLAARDWFLNEAKLAEEEDE
jgi:cytochrome c oxidase assembly factor CtaG